MARVKTKQQVITRLVTRRKQLLKERAEDLLLGRVNNDSAFHLSWIQQQLSDLYLPPNVKRKRSQ